MFHDITNWEWTLGHAGKTALDAVGLIPVVGMLKNADEATDLVTGALKHSDELVGGVKHVDDVIDAVHDAAKHSDELLEGMGNLKPGSLSNVEARQWYLNQEAKIKGMVDTTTPLEQQARQAFDLRNQFRTQARELMSDRVTADSLYKTDPNMTWDQIVNKYTNKGFSGDSLWQEIVNASTRSRTSVNRGLGLE